MAPTRPRRPVGVLLPCLLLAFCIHGPPWLALDTVSRYQPLSGGQKLVSRGGRFALGFFQPGRMITKVCERKRSHTRPFLK
ncbi:hypothetical protein GQ55_5G227700 [Panicum hallii var. hallii]|uniref:Uncharacterized protein n=1 Tax=Panicum hallii var. hallii TaxID=1504633 RepID=A0A2T7DJ97_9POAL|nr:hypothetical protein GQ55_5G227700 [Panicum hallii var. hallii]